MAKSSKRLRRAMFIIAALSLLGTVAVWLVWFRSTRPEHWSSGRSFSVEEAELGDLVEVPPSDLQEPDRSAVLPDGSAEAPTATAERRAEYDAPEEKTVVQLQQFRQLQTGLCEDADRRPCRALLINLNPTVNRWFLLQLDLSDELAGVAFHLENPAPATQRIVLADDNPVGIVVESAGQSHPCDLWGVDGTLLTAAASGRPFAPLCSEKLYLRNPVAGRKTTLEWATDFFRDNITWGEQITVFVRANFYADAYLQTSDLVEHDAAAAARVRPREAPARPSIDERYQDSSLVPDQLGLTLDSDTPGSVLVGRWYALRDNPGIFVSTVEAGLVAPRIAAPSQPVLNPIDEVERKALIFMVAFDLGSFDLGFALGTDHPRVDWSERAPESSRDPNLGGPDGFDTEQPIVRVGKINPVDAARTAATFTGGFKRSHGAFKWGRLSQVNGGTHYGFIENGVILSKPQPELATVIVYADGEVVLKTWTEADNADLWRIRHARQNGLPIIDYDEDTGLSSPGSMVANWSQGNWSGSQDQRLRTLRAGLCLQETEQGRFLIYGYFSGATPSGMAIVFEAYHCRYAMLLDMNALEHTYLATYSIHSSQFRVQHLIEEMSVLDKSDTGQYVPRFVGFPDNRDFFYFLRRSP